MGPIIRVREAISKRKFSLLSSLLLLSFLLVLNISIQEKGLFFIGILMVFEDFRTELIDMRLFFIAFVLLLSMANDYKSFLGLFLWGLLLIRILFLFTTKIKDKTTVAVSDNMPLEIERLPFGYLPSLAMSWCIYEFWVKAMDIPIFLIPSHYAFLLLRDHLINGWTMATISVVVGCFLIWATFEYRLHRAIVKNKNIQYGFGDGDVFVLAAVFAALGFEPFIVIFFISLLVQLIFYSFQILRDEVNFFHHGK